MSSTQEFASFVLNVEPVIEHAPEAQREKFLVRHDGGITHDHGVRSRSSFGWCQSMYPGKPSALKTTLIGLQKRAQSRLQCGFYV